MGIPERFVHKRFKFLSSKPKISILQRKLNSLKLLNFKFFSTYRYSKIYKKNNLGNSKKKKNTNTYKLFLLNELQFRFTTKISSCKSIKSLRKLNKKKLCYKPKKFITKQFKDFKVAKSFIRLESYKDSKKKQA